jgi:hypothetical protein
LKRIIVSIILFAITGCTPADKVSIANDAIQEHLASNVKVSIEKEKVILGFEDSDYFYVCGTANVEDKNHQNKQHKFITKIKKSADDGLTIFDGSSDEFFQTEFESSWKKNCK